MCRLLCDIKNNDAAAGLSIVFSVKHLIFGKNSHAQPFMKFPWNSYNLFPVEIKQFFQGGCLTGFGKTD
jgi:hypothetical protein